uniref:FERM domain-containing protein n=1 Tax=Chrysemys picta bellii TaxID=8478 RepID=A0A8C3FMQ2_CHRPI
MTARFRLPAGRTYNVRASELARDRQHTEVVCNILLLDNTVQAFRVHKNDQGQVLLDIVFKHLDLTERDYFGLQLADDSTDNPVSCICFLNRFFFFCMLLEFRDFVSVFGEFD